MFELGVGELADVDAVQIRFAEKDAVGVGFGRDVGLGTRQVCEGEGKIGEESFVDELVAEGLFGYTVFGGVCCGPNGFDVEFEIRIQGNYFAQETASLLGSVKWKACLTAVWVSWRRSRTVRSSWWSSWVRVGDWNSCSNASRGFVQVRAFGASGRCWVSCFLMKR